MVCCGYLCQGPCFGLYRNRRGSKGRVKVRTSPATHAKYWLHGLQVPCCKAYGTCIMACSACRLPYMLWQHQQRIHRSLPVCSMCARPCSACISINGAYNASHICRQRQQLMLKALCFAVGVGVSLRAADRSLQFLCRAACNLFNAIWHA